MKKITVRIPEEDYQILQVNAAKNGETVSYYLRKVISRETKNDAALTNRDTLISAVRKAIRLELKQTEKRLADLSAKAALNSAMTEELITCIMEFNNYPDINLIKNKCRLNALDNMRKQLNLFTQFYNDRS